MLVSTPSGKGMKSYWRKHEKNQFQIYPTTHSLTRQRCLREAVALKQQKVGATGGIERESDV